MKAVVLLLAMFLLLAFPSVGTARVGGSQSAALNLYFNVDFGIALDPTSFYMIPGPQLNVEQGIIITLVLHSTDNRTFHQVYVDMDDSSTLTAADFISDTFNSSSPAQMMFTSAWTGGRAYIDLVSPTTLYGIIDSAVSVAPPPVPPPSNNTTIPPPGPSWFRFDPFFIFGLMMELSLVAYLGWLILNFFRLRKLKKKLSDEDALKWAKAVMDPDTPARMNREQVLEYNRKNIAKKLKRLRPHWTKKKKKA